MARITLFRHGKAEAPNIEGTDFDRVLTNRGRLNAATMGSFIQRQNMLPDLVLVSPAARTQETYQIASNDWPEIPHQICDTIYDASASSLLMLIAAQSEIAENIMIIGHNPGLVVLLNRLVGLQHRDRNLSYFPTSCVADIGFAVDRLAQVEPDEGVLLSIIRARDLAVV